MVLDEIFFLEKNDTERSTKLRRCFPRFENYSALLEDTSHKEFVKCAKKRLRKALIDETYIQESEADIGWLRHDQLTLGSRLGKGSLCEVYEVKMIQIPDISQSCGGDPTGIPSEQRVHCSNDFVVKVLRPEIAMKPSMLVACAADLIKEGAIMASLKHENVLSVHAWTPQGLEGYLTGRPDGFFLVLDRLKYTLHDRIEQWREESRKLIFAFKQHGERKVALLQKRLDSLLQLGSAVTYLHSQGVLHRDLKPDNIGFDQNGVLKVYDFDVSRIMPQSSNPDETFELTKHVGSARYMSPECLRGVKYNLKADVYSFGLLCHEVISLDKPYEEIPQEFHVYNICMEGHRPWIPQTWTNGMRALLKSCWSDNIASRPTMEEARMRLEQEIPLTVAKKRAKYSRKTSWFSFSAKGKNEENMAAHVVLCGNDEKMTTFGDSS